MAEPPSDHLEELLFDAIVAFSRRRCGWLLDGLRKAREGHDPVKTLHGLFDTGGDWGLRHFAYREATGGRSLLADVEMVLREFFAELISDQERQAVQAEWFSDHPGEEPQPIARQQLQRVMPPAQPGGMPEKDLLRLMADLVDSVLPFGKERHPVRIVRRAEQPLGEQPQGPTVDNSDDDPLLTQLREYAEGEFKKRSHLPLRERKVKQRTLIDYANKPPPEGLGMSWRQTQKLIKLLPAHLINPARRLGQRES